MGDGFLVLRLGLSLEKFRWTAGLDFIPRSSKATDRLLESQKLKYVFENKEIFKKYKNF